MRHHTLALAVILSTCLVERAHASYVVAPPQYENVDPEGYECLPACTSFPTMRYQTIYDSSFFGGRAGMISSIAFREDMFSNGGFTTLNVLLEVGNAGRDPSNMSNVFADNRGTSMQTIHEGALRLGKPQHNSPSPIQPFDLVINFAAPWLYDGTSDIILDYHIYSYFYDNPFNGGPLISQAPYFTEGMETKLTPNVSASDTQGWGPNHDGYVTRFNFVEETTSVPEPVGLLLLGAGLSLLGLNRRRRKVLAA